MDRLIAFFLSMQEDLLHAGRTEDDRLSRDAPEKNPKKLKH